MLLASRDRVSLEFCRQMKLSWSVSEAGLEKPFVLNPVASGRPDLGCSTTPRQVDRSGLPLLVRFSNVSDKEAGFVRTCQGEHRLLEQSMLLCLCRRAAKQPVSRIGKRRQHRLRCA